MQIRTTLLALCLGGAAVAAAVTPQTPAAQTNSVDALFKDLRWRNIGPANMAGRVTDIDALESNPAIVYVAAASGGVWKSVNAGTTWEPIFTNYKTSSIGDVNDLPEGSQHRLGRHRRSLRPQQRGVGRRRLQIHRRAARRSSTSD